MTEAVEAARGQKNFKWLTRHKFPLLRKPQTITFWILVDLSKHLIKPGL